MAAISAKLVKELRERTGLGMMECKKALVQTEGDIEKAIEELRKSGQAKAAKKAGRIAAEGVVIQRFDEAAGVALMVEINSETDFVARDENFLAFANRVADAALSTGSESVAEVMEGELEEARNALIQKIGENISVRRIARLEGAVLSGYIHGTGKIGVLAAISAGSADVAKDVAMHVAATNPLVVSPDDMDQAVIDKEREIFSAQAAESGKPANIIEKMVEGRVRKFLAENSLVEQPFVKDPDQKVAAYVKGAGAAVTGFVRYEVGEGIEKEEVDFAAEVAAQAGM